MAEAIIQCTNLVPEMAYLKNYKYVMYREAKANIGVGRGGGGGGGGGRPPQ